MTRMLIAIVLLFLGAGGSLADGELDRLLTPADKARLEHFDQSSAAALDEAIKGGAAADVAELQRVLAGTPLPLADGYDPTGTWTCRTIKAGGLLPLTIYKPFRCIWAEDGAGWRFMKITGSQRTKGRFFTDSATRLIYVGAAHYDGEQPRLYGRDPQMDQVAVVERRGERRILMLFPEPAFESKLDLLVLER